MAAVTLTGDDVNNHDKCSSDELENKKVLRPLPLPSRNYNAYRRGISKLDLCSSDELQPKKNLHPLPFTSRTYKACRRGISKLDLCISDESENKKRPLPFTSRTYKAGRRGVSKLDPYSTDELEKKKVLCPPHISSRNYKVSLTFPMVKGPYPFIDPNRPRNAYPQLLSDPCGLLTLLMRRGIAIEMTLDRTVRILVNNKFSLAVDERGHAAGLMHPFARIVQEATQVFAQFGDTKLALIGSSGVMFCQKGQHYAYLVSSTRQPPGTLPIDVKYIRYPSINKDFTQQLIFQNAQSPSMTQEMLIELLNEAVRTAHYMYKNNEIIVELLGMTVRQFGQEQSIEIRSPPRYIRADPVSNCVSLRTHYVDMGIQDRHRAYVKRGVKRVHVSASGMVASDGKCTTSMDFMGRIVSSN